MFVFLYNIFNILGLLSSFTNLLIISVTPIKKVYQDIDTNVFKSSDQSGKKLISIVLILISLSQQCLVLLSSHCSRSSEKIFFNKTSIPIIKLRVRESYQSAHISKAEAYQSFLRIANVVSAPLVSEVFCFVLITTAFRRPSTYYVAQEICEMRSNM